jgi:hypothetical protein
MTKPYSYCEVCEKPIMKEKGCLEMVVSVEIWRGPKTKPVVEALSICKTCRHKKDTIKKALQNWAKKPGFLSRAK